MRIFVHDQDFLRTRDTGLTSRAACFDGELDSIEIELATNSVDQEKEVAFRE